MIDSFEGINLVPLDHLLDKLFHLFESCLYCYKILEICGIITKFSYNYLS